MPVPSRINRTPSGTERTVQRRRGRAALIIDADALALQLVDESSDRTAVGQMLLTVVRNLRHQLERRYGLQTTLALALADYDDLPAALQRELALAGVEPHFTPRTGRRPATDIQLCIDAVDTLYTHPEIDTFVLAPGERDILPLIHYLQRYGTKVLIAAVRGSISGEMLRAVGPRGVIDMLRPLENAGPRRDERTGAPRYSFDDGQEDGDDDEGRSGDSQGRSLFDDDDDGQGALGRRERSEEVGADEEPTEFADPQPIDGDDETTALRVILRTYGHHREVWISPYLRKLSDALPHLVDTERKALISTLEEKGALVVARRRGEPFDYSVIILNHEHPGVRAIAAE